MKIKRNFTSYLFIISLFTFSIFHYSFDDVYDAEELREIYGNGDSKKWPMPFLFDEVKPDFQEIGPLPKVEYPKDNPYSKPKAELGKLLFFDPRLSSSGQISCANCHNPELGWSDGMRVSVGHNRQLGTRNSPTILNIAYAKTFFWDGRAETLEEQAKSPIENPVEMHSSSKLAIKRIKKIKNYQPYFIEAFGDKNITEDRILKSLATFQRTLVSPKSRFDRFVSGEDKNALTDEEIIGLHIFRTKANCINCHYSPYFSDQKFHNLGLTYYGREYEDLGLYNVTKNNEDVGKFKTPTLREVSQTKPYMHNGLFPELRNIVMMYNAGMATEKRKEHQLNDPKFPKKSSMLQTLNLNKKEIDYLVAFLESLHSYKYLMRQPDLPQK